MIHTMHIGIDIRVVLEINQNVRLRISLLSVHVLQIAAGEDEEAIQDGIEIFLNPIAGETRLGLDYESLQISSEFTNDFWEQLPEVAKLAQQDNHGIWQQMIWEIEGNFEIHQGMSAEIAANSIGWELSFEHAFTEEQLEEPIQYFKVITASLV
jgi:hypothetical protein